MGIRCSPTGYEWRDNSNCRSKAIQTRDKTCMWWTCSRVTWAYIQLVICMHLAHVHDRVAPLGPQRYDKVVTSMRDGPEAHPKQVVHEQLGQKFKGLSQSCDKLNRGENITKGDDRINMTSQIESHTHTRQVVQERLGQNFEGLVQSCDTVAMLVRGGNIIETDDRITVTSQIESNACGAARTGDFAIGLHFSE